MGKKKPSKQQIRRGAYLELFTDAVENAATSILITQRVLLSAQKSLGPKSFKKFEEDASRVMQSMEGKLETISAGIEARIQGYHDDKNAQKAKQ